MDGTETLAVLQDPQAKLSLTLYYTAFDNDATIASYSKLEVIVIRSYS